MARSQTTHILVFAGSTRHRSFSRRLAAAASLAIAGQGAKPTLIDLADFDAPLFNADLEDRDGIPQTVLDFRRLVATHDALCLATPEYNGGLTPLLLNMFCWASRPSPTDDFGSVSQDKPVALMASSPGRLGGVRAIPRLRDCVCELGMLPVPGFVSVGNAAQAFSDNGHLRDDGLAQSLHALVRRLVACAG